MQRAVVTDQNCANFYLNQIAEEIDNQNGDCLLYGLVLLLYKRKYNELPYNAKKHFKNQLIEKKIDLDLLKQSMYAVMEECTRKDSKDEIEAFFHEINTSNVVIAKKHYLMAANRFRKF